MLLLEGLLNFSRDILPSNRGGQMDAPLVLTTQLLPSQIDKEALNVDCSWMYPSEFYEATISQPHPSEVKHLVDMVDNRVGTVGDVRGYGWTHDSDGLSSGPSNSQYKILDTMREKMDAQLALASQLRTDPTVPADPSNLERPAALALRNDCAVQLPPKHCAFRHCGWWGDTDTALLAHLRLDHSEALEKVSSLLPACHTEEE